MGSTIKAIIFDFGGVVPSSPFEAFNRMEAAKGIPLDSVRWIASATGFRKYKEGAENSAGLSSGWNASDLAWRDTASLLHQRANVGEIR